MSEKRMLVGVEYGTETVLVIEDEEMIREIAQRVLEKWGYTVLVATDGQEGVEIFQQEQEHIALILLDVMMPRMNGDRALAEIRRISPDIKVIVSSGYGTTPQLEAIEKFGVSGKVSKPYRPIELAKAVRAVLDGEPFPAQE